MTGRPRKPIEHGTESGYQAHYKRGIPTCAECRAAHSEKSLRWKAVLIVCRDCGREKTRHTRDRCVTCYQRLRRARKGKP